MRTTVVNRIQLSLNIEDSNYAALDFEGSSSARSYGANFSEFYPLGYYSASLSRAVRACSAGPGEAANPTPSQGDHAFLANPRRSLHQFHLLLPLPGVDVPAPALRCWMVHTIRFMH